MSDRITITSTTDDVASINAAAQMIEGDELVQSAEEQPETAEISTEGGEDSGAVITRSRSIASTDTPEQIQEVQKDLDEQREENAAVYLGKTRRKLLRNLSRVAAERDDLRGRLAKYESGEQRTNDGQQTQQQQQQTSPEHTNEEQMRWEAAKLQAEIAHPYKIEAAKARYSDFEQSLNAAKTEVPLWTIDAVKMMNNGPDVAYWLSKHTNYCDELLRLDRAGQGQKAYELLSWVSNGLSFGQLHNQPSSSRSNGSATKRPMTTAPAPIRPVGGGAHSPHITDADLDYRTYKRLRDEQERSGRR